MLEADQSYLCQNSPTITLRQLFAAHALSSVRKHPLRIALQGLHNPQQFQHVNPPLTPVQVNEISGSDGGWHMKAKHEQIRRDVLFYRFIFRSQLTDAEGITGNRAPLQVPQLCKFLDSRRIDCKPIVIPYSLLLRR